MCMIETKLTTKAGWVEIIRSIRAGRASHRKSSADSSRL